MFYSKTKQNNLLTNLISVYHGRYLADIWIANKHYLQLLFALLAVIPKVYSRM